MLKAYKTEIFPTPNQKQIIHRTIGVCRFVYNFYLAHNKEIYEKEEKFVSGYDFSKWLNHEYLPQNPEFSWIQEVSSKSVKQSIMNTQRAFRNFFEHRTKFQRWKKKRISDVKMYFVRNGKTQPIFCERHRIRIPTLDWIRLKKRLYSVKFKNICHKKRYNFHESRKILCFCFGGRTRTGKACSEQFWNWH